MKICCSVFLLLAGMAPLTSAAGVTPAAVADFKPDELQKGTAVHGDGPNFVWAIASSSEPRLVIDDGEPLTMHRFAPDGPWIYTGQLETGTSHGYYYLIDGRRFGGKTDVPAFLPDSYEKGGVPQGHMSDKIVQTSKIYPGMETNYWVYAPAQYDGRNPAALMVWQDGEKYVNRAGSSHALTVIDNLTHQGKIPVAIWVFISPGKVGEKAMRSIEYDTVDDTYARFLRDEILPEVNKGYKLRTDGYSHGIAGESSGGICAFDAAWFRPEMFTRVLSRIGSFTSIQWHPGEKDGGNVFPFMIRKQPKRNIRVWLQDGSNDLENAHGSWPLQNIEMANSLKMRDYDFHLHFGNGTHNTAQGNAELPVALAWLWRGYDPAKTEQVYTMDPEEREKPYFRVKLEGRP